MFEEIAVIWNYIGAGLLFGLGFSLAWAGVTSKFKKE